jgi:hypothetical protein
LNAPGEILDRRIEITRDGAAEISALTGDNFVMMTYALLKTIFKENINTNYGLRRVFWTTRDDRLGQR